MASRKTARIVIPGLVLAHLGYFLVYTHHASPAPPVWDLLYWIGDPMYMFLLLGSLVCLVYRDRLTFWDLQFLIVSGVFNLLRGVCYFGNYFGMIQHTANFELIGYGTFIALLIVIFNIVRIELY